MVFLCRHYGPEPAINLDAEFTDEDRRWLTNHPSGGGTIQQLLADDHIVLHKNEIDASMAGENEFAWHPLNFSRQRYDLIVKCRDGRFEEQLWYATNSAGGLLEALRIKQIKTYADSGEERILFECVDANFAQDRTDLPSTSTTCDKAMFTHLGDRQLPLRLQDDSADAGMLVGVLIFAFLVCLPLYCGAAHWWIGIPDLLADSEHA